ncbi:MAG: rod shape-determining protein MreC [Terriglobales bacterium]
MARRTADFRHRSHGRWLLGALVVGQLLLLGYQVRRPDARGISSIRLWSAEAVLPAEALSEHFVSGTHHWLANYVTLRHAHEQNLQLQHQLIQLELQNQQLRQDVRDLPRLDALLGFQHGYGLATLPAQVISHGASVDAQAIYINRGRHNGLRRNMAVITPQGLVGKLSQVLGSSAQVLLITDPESGVGVAMGAKGVRGILHGLGAGRVEVENVLKDEPIAVGDQVVTSGLDQVFPAGIPVGTVTGVVLGNDGVFKKVKLKPAANLGRLQAVLIITAQLPEPAESKDSGLTAADVREQRLPGLAQPAAGIGPAAPPQTQLAIPTPPPDLPMPAAAMGLQPVPQPVKPAAVPPARAPAKPANAVGTKANPPATPPGRG